MESNTIKVNGQEITVFANGYVERPFRGRLKLTTGTATGRGYKTIRIGYKDYRMHRLIAMALLPDYSEDLQVDHINGIKDDNRLENLRMKTCLDNRHGHHTVKEGASSKYRGVTKRDEKTSTVFEVYITINKVAKYLGRFKNELDAAKEFNKAAIAGGFPQEGLNQI
jgi:hypothetical protein